MDLSTMHAEIGSMKQAIDGGVRGGEGVLVVQGKVVCQPYCTGDVKTMARALDLDKLTVLDDDGLLYHFPDPQSLQPVKRGGQGW